MKTLFLLIALAGAVVSLVGIGPEIVVNLGIPVFAVMFSLFLIFTFLGGESELYEEQKRAEAKSRGQ